MLAVILYWMTTPIAVLTPQQTNIGIAKGEKKENSSLKNSKERLKDEMGSNTLPILIVRNVRV